jgi:hypothetical protein
VVLPRRIVFGWRRRRSAAAALHLFDGRRRHFSRS